MNFTNTKNLPAALVNVISTPALSIVPSVTNRTQRLFPDEEIVRGRSCPQYFPIRESMNPYPSLTYTKNVEVKKKCKYYTYCVSL